MDMKCVTCAHNICRQMWYSRMYKYTVSIAAHLGCYREYNIYTNPYVASINTYICIYNVHVVSIYIYIYIHTLTIVIVHVVSIYIYIYIH